MEESQTFSHIPRTSLAWLPADPAVCRVLPVFPQPKGKLAVLTLGRLWAGVGRQERKAPAADRAGQ